MLSRAFLTGVLAVAVPAGAAAVAVALKDDGGVRARPPVNTVQGAPATLGPPLVSGNIPTRPLAPTAPAAPRAAVPDFAMPSKAGNRLVAALIRDLRGALRAKRLTTAAGVSTAIGAGLARIAARGFDEVYDLPVRRAIGAALDRDLVAAGIDPAAIVIR